MPSTNVSLLTDLVLWACFFVSLLFGVIAQRAHFCTMGALSDAVNLGNWTRMRQWACAAGVAMIGYAAMSYLGWIDPARSIYATTTWLWLSALLGGVLFGFGMVLASGCGSKTLLRVGAGSLKSVVVFLTMAVAAFATLKGVSAVARVATVDRVSVEFSSGTSLADLASVAFGGDVALARVVLSLLLGGGLMGWALLGREFRQFDNLLAGVGIGGTVIAMWWVSGSLGHVMEHPETLQETFLATNSGRMEALTFTAPMAYTLDWLIYFSDKNKVLTMAIASVLGVISGSALHAIKTRSFRWQGFRNTEDLANHLVGASLMGVGGVTAMGCTIGQGLSGVSTLSLTSFVAVIGIVIGAIMAFRYQVRRLEQSE